jgi:hypothetical protein
MPDVPSSFTAQTLQYSKSNATGSAAAAQAANFVSKAIPAPILGYHENVTLCVDFFFLQRLPFLHTISPGISFRTSHAVPDRTRVKILKCL